MEKASCIQILKALIQLQNVNIIFLHIYFGFVQIMKHTFKKVSEPVANKIVFLRVFENDKDW